MKHFRAELRKNLVEMQRANERILKNREEIQWLKSKTRNTLAELRSM